MEAVEAFLDGEWESLSKLFSCEDSDFLLHFNGSNLFSNHGEIPSNFFAAGDNVAEVNGSFFLPSDTLDTSFYCVSQESSNSSEIESALFTCLGDENHQMSAANGVNFLHDVTTNTFESMDFCPMDSKNDSLMVPVFPDDLMEEILQLKAQMCNDELGNAAIQPAETDDSCKEMQLKRKYETPGIHSQDKGYAFQSSEDNSSESPKKRPRVSRDVSIPKKKLISITFSNNVYRGIYVSHGL